MKTWALWLLAASAAGAQEAEIVAVADSLSPPDPKGAVLVGAGGSVARAAFAHPKLREALDEYIEVAGFQAVYLSPKEARVKRGLAAGECLQVGTLAFVGAETRDGLVRALASAPQESQAVLLTRHDPVEVADWMRATPRVRLAIVSGHSPFGPEALRVAEGQYLVVAPRAGQFARIRLKGTTVTSAFENVGEPSEAVKKFFADRGIPLRGFAESKGGGESLPETGPLADLPPGTVRTLGASASNRALRATVRTVALRGRRLALDVEWVNAVPLSLVYEKKVAEEVRLADLAERLFVVVDGARVCRLESSELKEIRLDAVGATSRGTLAFEVPEFRAIEFRFYDPVHGPAAVPLVRKSDPPAANPISAVERNKVVELAVYGARFESEFGGKKAASGTKFLVVDLRGRSLSPAVLAWKELRFLPDVTAGGLVAVEVPEGSASYDLKCEFSGAKAIAFEIRP